ncbi:hypothetical protein PCK1_002168 [Pneumocystis canis]|nr:hypothetical protein PCK1_002168 [Pneumocystis canis]
MEIGMVMAYRIFLRIIKNKIKIYYYIDDRLKNQCIGSVELTIILKFLRYFRIEIDINYDLLELSSFYFFGFNCLFWEIIGIIFMYEIVFIYVQYIILEKYNSFKKIDLIKFMIYDNQNNLFKCNEIIKMYSMIFTQFNKIKILNIKNFYIFFYYIKFKFFVSVKVNYFLMRDKILSAHTFEY